MFEINDRVEVIELFDDLPRDLLGECGVVVSVFRDTRCYQVDLDNDDSWMFLEEELDYE